MLQSRLSQRDVKLDLTDKRDINISMACELAMLDYASGAIEKYKANEYKALNKEAAGLIPSLVRGELKLWMRNWFFKRAKKQAIIRANTENRKCYVIRSSDIAYKILSTKDVEINKRLKVFGKEVNAVKLTEKADFVAYPKRIIKKN
jgi:hypothetical protein